jgi:hypothetical protein
MLAVMDDAVIQEAHPEILNSGFDFIRDAVVETRHRFEGVPAKLLLRDGHTLYRFLEAALAGPFEFWLPVETYHYLRRAPSKPDWALWRSPHSRSKPSLFCSATLHHNVYGFRGCVRIPGEARAITLTGMVTRSVVWIPGLSREDFFARSYRLDDPM